MELVYRGGITVFETDQYNHMNVQFYCTKAEAGLAAFAQILNLTPERMKQDGLDVEITEQHIRFLREQFAGAPISIYAGATRIDEHHLQVYAELQHTLKGEPATTFTNTLTLVDRFTRAPVPLPSDVRAQAEALRTEIPTHAQPRGVSAGTPHPVPTRAEAQQLRMPVICQDLVRPADCDASSFLMRSHHISAISSASANLGAIWKRRNRIPRNHGGATMEYRWLYHKRPKAGDVVVIHSGYGAVSEKTYTLIHWAFDHATGEAVARGEVLLLNFDLETRKAVALAPEHRAQMEEAVTPGLSL